MNMKNKIFEIMILYKILNITNWMLLHSLRSGAYTRRAVK